LVTLETLTTLRAQQGRTVRSVTGGLDDQGKPYAFQHDEADQGKALIAIERAYGVPICGEYDVSGNGVRFPFAIERNQRLVDALDALKANSNGFAQWRLLHGRIIITFRVPPEDGSQFVMDRVIKADFEARTWKELLMQIETAYNAQYLDVPLLASSFCIDMEKEVPLVAGDAKEPFRFQGEAPLREVVLSIIDDVGDASFYYGLSGCSDARNGFHYRFRIWRKDCRVDFETVEERAAQRQEAEERDERLNAYVERINAAKEK